MLGPLPASKKPFDDTIHQFSLLNAAIVPNVNPKIPDKNHEIPIRAAEAPALIRIISMTGFL